VRAECLASYEAGGHTCGHRTGGGREEGDVGGGGGKSRPGGGSRSGGGGGREDGYAEDIGGGCHALRGCHATSSGEDRDEGESEVVGGREEGEVGGGGGGARSGGGSRSGGGLKARPRYLRVVGLGGEVMAVGLAREWADRVCLVNLYGCTECTGSLRPHTLVA
jgi:hypothetical protein